MGSMFFSLLPFGNYLGLLGGGWVTQGKVSLEVILVGVPGMGVVCGGEPWRCGVEVPRSDRFLALGGGEAG